jgi:AcrR family transcriptional regulator
MPRAALSPEQIDEFRERLVEAATRLFAQRGYDGVTLRGIAAELGCSPMTPYRYFEDKAEIFAAVRTEAYSSFADAQAACCVAGAAPLETLIALGRAYIQFALDHPDAYRLMFELGQPDPDGFPELRAAEARAIAPLREWMGHAVEADIMAGDPDILTQVFWSGVHGLASLHLAGKLVFGISVDALLDPVLQTLFLGNRAGGPHEA